MGNKLLVRAYDVEVGDCIYCRIPDAREHEDGTVDDFHILIDCGTKGAMTLLEDAIAHLEKELPLENGKRRLDLLVVTHEHADHIKGFDPALFKKIKIGSIWLSAAMDPKHPQAKNTQNLHAFAETAMRGVAKQGFALSPQMAALVELYGVQNDVAMKALRVDLPKASGIKPQYVHAGQDETTLGLPLVDAHIRVIGPEQDIDGFYLGEAADPALRGLTDSIKLFRSQGRTSDSALPANVSEADFRRLQSRMLSSSFAFAELASKVKNNASVVLLIEWEEKRLLFVGDAEWELKFKEGRHNGGWNVMWHERKNQLNAPIHFLKIGHHGSTNSTPWNDKEDGTDTEPSKILDAILPRPSGRRKPKAAAIVSTMRKNYQTIPKSALLAELGKRVSNVRDYHDALTQAQLEPADLPKFEQFEKEWLDKKQPWRTDVEGILSPTGFVEIEIAK